MFVGVCVSVCTLDYAFHTQTSNVSAMFATCAPATDAFERTYVCVCMPADWSRFMRNLDLCSGQTLQPRARETRYGRPKAARRQLPHVQHVKMSSRGPFAEAICEQKRAHTHTHTDVQSERQAKQRVKPIGRDKHAYVNVFLFCALCVGFCASRAALIEKPSSRAQQQPSTCVCVHVCQPM